MNRRPLEYIEIARPRLAKITESPGNVGTLKVVAQNWLENRASLAAVAARAVRSAASSEAAL